MSRKDGIHYSKIEQEEIFKSEGFDSVEAEDLSQAMNHFSFMHFDALYLAIKKIKKGV